MSVSPSNVFFSQFFFPSKKYVTCSLPCYIVFPIIIVQINHIFRDPEQSLKRHSKHIHLFCSTTHTVRFIVPKCFWRQVCCQTAQKVHSFLLLLTLWLNLPWRQWWGCFLGKGRESCMGSRIKSSHTFYCSRIYLKRMNFKCFTDFKGT